MASPPVHVRSLDAPPAQGPGRQDLRRLLRAERRHHSQLASATGGARAARPSFTGGANWDAIAFCESHGSWSLNSGNGFWGGLQFSPHTWFAYGGGPFDGVGSFPYSRTQQIAVAERVLAGQGPGAWPVCFVGG